MALTRKFLSALGIEADKVDEIISAHSETVNALKAERDEAQDKAQEVETLTAENKKLKKQIADAEEAGNKDDVYKVKYDAIKEEFEAYKKGIEDEKAAKTKKDAFREFLKGLGISEKRIDSVIKVSDLSKVEVEDGKIKDTDNKLSDALKEEWADFIVTEGTKGADTKKPPQDKGGKDDADTTAATNRVAQYYANKYGNKIETKEE